MLFYIKLHFTDISEYHSHISEKHNMTVSWLLLTGSFLSCSSGFGSGLNKYIYEAVRLLGFHLLISREYKDFSDCTESCIESHSLHAAGMFSSVLFHCGTV